MLGSDEIAGSQLDRIESQRFPQSQVELHAQRALHPAGAAARVRHPTQSRTIAMN